MSALLEVHGLNVSYGRGRRTRQVLYDVDLSVAAGETVGLVGESGSGKSTTAKAILGEVPISRGSVQFDGLEISALRRGQRRALSQRIQVVFQNPFMSLNPQRTVGQSVAEALAVRTDLSASTVRERVLESLDRVGIPRSAAQRYPASFSGGQRQRIAIARALAPHPEFVICDEAVSALDLSVQAQVINLLISLQDELGLACLFITHDLSVVKHLCHRVVVMRAGRVVEHGPTARVCAAPSHEYTRLLLDSAPIADPTHQAAARRRRGATTLTSPPPSSATLRERPINSLSDEPKELDA